jgi:hypothetical protein
MRRRKEKFTPRGRVAVQCRLSDWQFMDHDEFEGVQPLRNGKIGFYTGPWPSEWFDPDCHLLRFPYMGSSENSTGQLWFACDGQEVVSFVGWAQSFSEMKSTSPKTATGERDQERLATFERYVEVRTRADAIIRASAKE